MPYIPIFRLEHPPGYNHGGNPASYDKSSAFGLEIAMRHPVKLRPPSWRFDPCSLYPRQSVRTFPHHQAL